ncbi:MAG: hypothetical protein ACRD4H_10215, partial [Candidatus Acidiferrales bacterium]
MRLIIMLTGIPVALVAALHWHWIKEQAIHCFVAEVIRSVWHALTGLWRATKLLLNPMDLFAVLLPDPAAVLNWTMILGGFASLLCAASFPTKLRPALVLGGLVGIAAGMSGEAARTNPLRQLSNG